MLKKVLQKCYPEASPAAREEEGEEVSDDGAAVWGGASEDEGAVRADRWGMGGGVVARSMYVCRRRRWRAVGSARGPAHWLGLPRPRPTG